MSNPAASLPPGFRFHPTDAELILHYLKNRAGSKPCPVSIIAEVDIYKFNPWDLPAKAVFGDREWYFFSPRDRKYPNGVRPNRAAASGYWKATGTDKPIVGSKGSDSIGVKKALVFYRGKPPKGVKTDWIMHEYRLTDAHNTNNSYKPNKLRDSSMRLDDWVLCRIYKKSNHQSVSSEQEDSCVIDDAITTPNYTTNPNYNTNAQEINPLKLPKVCSLSELFEAVDCSTLTRLLDNPPYNIIGLDNNYATNDVINITNDVDDCQLMHHINQQGECSNILATENQLKRHRKMEENYFEDDFHAKKPLIMPSIFNYKLDGNLFSQQFLTQQVMLNSHLGFH